jgi:hypothetical protein
MINREIRVEKAWNRISLVPLLQAETDRDIVRRQEAYKQKESTIMQSVDNWTPLDLKTPVKGLGKTGIKDAEQAEPVYHTAKYVNPTYYFLPKEDGDLVDAQWWRGSKMFTKNPPYHER